MKYFLKIVEISSVLVVSTAMIMYGIGKFVQFPATVDITKKVSELSGQELMWAFYGYSKAFPIILGILETLGGVLLLFRQTRLLSTILLSTILVNVILQDIIYHVNQGALIAAIIYQLLIFGILVINKERVVLIFKSFTETEKNSEKGNLKMNVLKIIYIGLLFILLKGLEYFVTH
ncbi:MAG: hypothetical protein V4585_06130 [Bacteroidota bacterium]|jgi:hypothetical protein